MERYNSFHQGGYGGVCWTGCISYCLIPDDYQAPEELTASDAVWMRDELKKFNEERDTNKDGRMDADEIKAWVIPDFNGSIVEEVKHLMKEADHDKVCLIASNFFVIFQSGTLKRK